MGGKNGRGAARRTKITGNYSGIPRWRAYAAWAGKELPGGSEGEFAARPST